MKTMITKTKSSKKDRVVTESILERKLEKFATKKDMEEWGQQIVQDLSDLQDTKWEENDAKWKEADKKFDRLLTGQDRILKVLDDLVVDNSVGADQTRRLRVDVDNHEERLKVLESGKN